MVQYITHAPQAAVDETVRSNLAKTFNQANEFAIERQQYERDKGRLQKALGEVRGLANKQNATPFDVAAGLMEATAGIPGAERYVGQLFGPLSEQVMRKRIGQDFPAGQAVEGGVQPMQGGAPQQSQQAGQAPLQKAGAETQQMLSLQELMPPSQPQQGQIADPRFPGGTTAFTAPYTPEAISEIRNKARSLGYPKDYEDYLVSNAQELNTNARTAYNDKLTSYQAQEKLREDTIANQKLFNDYIDQEAPEFAKNPDERELARIAGEEEQNEPSFAKRMQKVRQKLRPYQAAKESLNKALQRPLFGMSKDQMRNASQSARFMVDKGQKDQLKLMIANNGHGQIEEAMLLNPLPEDQEIQLKNLPKVTPVENFLKSADPESKEYQKQLEQGTQAKQKQMQDTSGRLAQIIKPGTWNDPGTNLLLTRKYLMDKGLNYVEAQTTILDAVKRGQIKLDPQQEIDLQKLGYPPLGNEDYLDNVMEYMLFGKE